MNTKNIRSGDFRWWNLTHRLPFGMANGRYLCNEDTEAKGIYRSLTDAFPISDDDVICDLACGTGIYHSLISNGSVFGIDFSASALKLAAERNPHVSYIYCDLHETSALEQLIQQISPTKIVINNYVHCLSDDELKKMVEICLECDTVRHVFVGDIPLEDKKKKVHQNRISISYVKRSLRFLFIRNITKFFISRKNPQKQHAWPIARNYLRKDIEKLIKSISSNIQVRWHEQSRDNMFYNSRENLVIERC